MQIREMTKEDAAQVAELERQCIANPWSENSFTEALSLAYTCYLTAESDGKVVGYCGCYRSFEEADIVNAAVAPAYRRKQIGRQLLLSLIERCASQGVSAFTLEVRASNKPAIALYESLGFRTEAVRKRFYQNPEEDALIMWKRLPEPDKHASDGSNFQ